MFYGPPINYDQPVFRPPSEGRSLLFQVTIGCSNNKCTYCDMYRSKIYRERSIEEIKIDIEKAATWYNSMGASPEKIFLCDGDALGAPTELLSSVLDVINEHFPKIKRVGVYATAENMLGKSEEELRLLRDKKLGIVYLGLESGADKVLHMIVKGNTAEEMVEASLKIKRAGYKLSTIVMLGIGGRKFSDIHIAETIEMINKTAPHYLSFLTTMVVSGTPLDRMVNRGSFECLTAKEMFFEMKEILGGMRPDLENPIIFRANHVSNQYPLAGNLPEDRDQLFDTVTKWYESTPEGVYPPRPNQM